MHEAFDAWFQLHERTIVGDVGDLAGELRARRIFRGHAFPRIGLELLHAERDALRLVVDLDDLHGDALADRQNFRRVRNAAPCDVGDMQQAIDAAEIDERAVIGDVLDHAFDNLLLLKRGDERCAFFGAAFFQNRAARDHDVAAAAIHFQDLEQLLLVHQRADIAHRANVHLATGKERDRAVEIDGEATLHAAEDHAVHAGLFVEGAFQTDPAFFAASLVAAEDGFTERVLDTLQINLDLIADIHIGGLAGHREFLEGNAAFGLQTDIDQGEIVFDGDNGALDDVAFSRGVGLEAVVQHRDEIVAAGSGDGSLLGCGACHLIPLVQRACQTAFAADFPADANPQGDGFDFRDFAACPDAPPGFQPLWLALERGPDPGFDQRKGGCEGRVYIQIGGVEQEGVFRLLQGGDRAGAVGGIPGGDFGQNFGLDPGNPHALKFQPAPVGAHGGGPLHEQFGGGVRGDHRPDIAPVHHRALGMAGRIGEEFPLEIEQRLAHRRDRGDIRSSFPHHIGTDRRIARPRKVYRARAFEGVGFVFRIAVLFKNRKRRQPVKRAGIEMRKIEMPRQLLGERALAGCGGTIDGDHDRFWHQTISRTQPVS